MKLFAGITVNEGGMNMSVRAMRSEIKMFQLVTNNITRFGQVGYQKKIPVKTSFAEYIGSHGVDAITDTTPGRMRRTANPLDLILEKSGYFQVKGKETIKLTRDGRFEIDKDGYLVNLDSEKVLGADGEPIKFKTVPGELKDILIDPDGTINIYSRAMNAKIIVGRLGVASEDGTPVREVTVRQGYTEDSNVNLADEFFNILPYRRNFEANRQAFIMQSDNQNKLIQTLGRGQ